MLRKRFNSVLAATLLTVITGTAMAVGDPKDTGDIVGRDLSSYGAGRAGHVGIWTGGDSATGEVLEVLKKTPVIQKNSLASFKNATTYWGAKYGRGSKHYQVTYIGWEQSAYNPSYTMTAKYRVGRMEKICVAWSSGRCTKEQSRMINAEFRCDTFVWYAYKKGIGEDLLNGSDWILPSIIYNNMPNER